MKKSLMQEDAIAMVNYDCKTPKGYLFNVTAELVDGWGHEYGNHHGIVITEESGYQYGLDARYDSRFNTTDGFYETILDVLKDRYAIAEAELTYKE